MKFETYRFEDITINFDKMRVPLSTMERARRPGEYRYYGAQGVIDYIDDYICDGQYLLIAEDGENLKSKKLPIAYLVEGKFWVNNHAHIIKANDKCVLEYLYYLMNYIDLSGYITGSAQPKLSQKNMNSIEFKLPNIEVQKKIVSVLGRLDGKIKYNEQINENLEEQAQAIFKAWFVDISATQSFTDAVCVLGGGTPKTTNANYWNGDIPFFTPKDTGELYTISTEKTLTEEGLSNCNSRLYPVNTVFVTARGTVGKLALAGCPMAMNQSCYALVSNGDYGQYYVYHLAVTVVERLRRKANGAVFDAIVTRDFETELIPAPEFEQIQAFEYKVTPFYNMILNNCLENRRLISLRDALLPKLMSGEIDVSNI